MSIVRIDSDQLPEISAAELKRLEAMGDEDIDLSELPEITEEEARLAKPNPFIRTGKGFSRPEFASPKRRDNTQEPV